MKEKSDMLDSSESGYQECEQQGKKVPFVIYFDSALNWPPISSKRKMI